MVCKEMGGLEIIVSSKIAQTQEGDYPVFFSKENPFKRRKGIEFKEDY